MDALAEAAKDVAAQQADEVGAQSAAETVAPTMRESSPPETTEPFSAPPAAAPSERPAQDTAAARGGIEDSGDGPAPGVNEGEAAKKENSRTCVDADSALDLALETGDAESSGNAVRAPPDEAPGAAVVPATTAPPEEAFVTEMPAIAATATPPTAGSKADGDGEESPQQEDSNESELTAVGATVGEGTAAADAAGAPAAAVPPAPEQPMFSISEIESLDWHNVTKDGKVRKRVIQQGQGQMPGLHAVCLVHYKGRLKSTGDVVMDTEMDQAGDPAQVVAGRDCVLKEKGLNLGVAGMRVGEHCELEVSWEYAYGERGSFSFPCVPPYTDLVYTVRLLAATPPQKKDIASMFFEERLEAAQRQRQEANKVFSAGEAGQALADYQAALTFVDEEFMFQLEGPHMDMAERVKAPILLNIAACHLRLQAWNEAITASSEVIKMLEETDDVEALQSKALFRRARARSELQQTDEALKDLQEAAALCPDDAEVARMLKKVQGQRKREDAAMGQLFRGKLRPTSTESSKAAGVEDDVATTKPSIGERLFMWVVAFFARWLKPVLVVLGLARKPDKEDKEHKE